MPDVKLGKKLGVVHDPRTFAAMQVLQPTEVRVPREHRIAGHLHQVPVFANDRYGDCTCASQAHRVVAQERSSGQARKLTLTDEDVLAVYSAVTGFQPDRPETDQGAYELDVLNYMRQHGMGRERDGSPHTIAAFVKVDQFNHDQVRLAHYVFGGLKVCAGLPLSAADQVDAGEAWEVVNTGRARWGSWGGHSMYSVGYDQRGALVFTWGREQHMSWSWWDAYVDECYALISEDYMRHGGSTPQGFDADALAALLASL